MVDELGIVVEVYGAQDLTAGLCRFQQVGEQCASGSTGMLLYGENLEM